MSVKQEILRKNFKLAKKDIITSFRAWRIFGLMGLNDIKKRYARSKLGQFWLTLSLAINVSALGFVWAFLFKMPVQEYMPFLATGTIFWTYISTCITEGSNLFINNSSYLKELNIPKVTYINSLFVRNKIVLFHNLLVLLPVYIFCIHAVIPLNVILAFIGLVLTTIFLFNLIILISIFSLRFRDFPNIVVSLLQIVFYLTPVMWKIELLPERAHKFMILNPLGVFLSLCRNPLLGMSIPSYYWLAALLYIIIAFALSLPFFAKFRSRIVYWI